LLFGLSDDLATYTHAQFSSNVDRLPPPSVNAGKACPAGPPPAESCEMFTRERDNIADQGAAANWTQANAYASPASSAPERTDP
jgi:hypothetical protein